MLRARHEGVAPTGGGRLVLRVSATDRCSLRCRYCMPARGIAPWDRDEVLSFEEIRAVVRAVAAVAPRPAVRLTGGEPLLREGIVDLVAMLAAEQIGDLALTTNGQRLAGTARRLKAAGLRRVNISLDTLDPDRFAALTRGGRLARTLAGIDAALAAGLEPVKLNAVALRGINDAEIPALARHALARGCRIRFIELMPIGEAGRRGARWFLPEHEIAARLAEAFELGARRRSGSGPAATVPVRCRRTGLRGAVGLIAPRTHPFCEGCRRLRLTSRGELLACLRHEGGLDLRALLRSGRGPAALERAVREALAAKGLSTRAWRRAAMATVGG